MSGRKTWRENVSLQSSETKAALQALEGAFSDGELCYQTIQELASSGSAVTAKGILPKEFISAKSASAFNSLIKRKNWKDPLSSPLNWVSSQAFPQIPLIKAEPPSNKDYLSINVEGDEKERKVKYVIRKSDDSLHSGERALGTCYLCKADSDKFDAILNALKPPHCALVSTPDGRLHFFSPGPLAYTIKPIPKKGDTVAYEALSKNINSLPDANKLSPSTKQVRADLTAIYQPTSFEIDEIPLGLQASQQNQYDGRLDNLITGIKEEAALNTVEKFNPINLHKLAGNDFQNKLGSSIVLQLSRDELFRYQMAYLSLKNPNEKLKNIFIQQAKQKILKDTLTDIKAILKDNSLALPAETQTLAKAMLDSILYQSVDRQIIELRRLKHFLGTNWAKGLALADGVESQPIPKKTADELQPYAMREVMTPKALPIDEKMPNYQVHKDLFDPFKKQLSRYNAKIEIDRTYQAIKTHFYMPKNATEFAELKKNKRNAFIWFQDKLHHINSDGTMRALPSDLQKAIWGQTKHAATVSGDMSSVMHVVDAPITASQRKNLPDDQFYMIYHRSTNTYRIGYKENGAYREKAFNKLLGNDIPFDPGIVLAQHTLKKAESGSSFLDYAKARMAQLPRSGKYFSVVHRGKLNFHWGYQFVSDRSEKLEKNTIYVYENQQGEFYYSIITPNNDIILDKKLESIKNINGIDTDKKLQAAVIEEIYQNGHAYKPSMGQSVGFVSDPTTVWARYWTKAGNEELKNNWRSKGAKAYTTRMAAMADQMPGGGFSETRREALGMAALMSQGDLSLNRHIEIPDCGIGQYNTAADLSDADLSKNEHFIKHCLNNDVGNYMYYLHVSSQPGSPQGNPVGFYFVDKSTGTPVITKVAPPVVGMWSKSVSDATSKFGAPKPEEDSPEKFYHDVHAMLQTALSVMYTQAPDNRWEKLGFEHRTPGAVIYPEVIQLPDAPTKKSELLVRINSVVCGEDKAIIVTAESKGTSDKEYKLHFLKGAVATSIVLDEKTDHKWLFDGLKKQPLSDEFLEKLNKLLQTNGATVQVSIRKPNINKMSVSLRKAIEARTHQVHIPADVYDTQREKYAHIEVSNRLSYVVAQRRELWQRYKKERLDTFKKQLEAHGFKIHDDLSLPPSQWKEKEVYIHPETFALTIASNDGQPILYDNHKKASDAGVIKELIEPDNIKLSELNRQILAEQYRTEELSQESYERLVKWYQMGQIDEPPIQFSKNVLYLYQDKADNKWVCLGVNQAGKLFQTKRFDSAANIDDILKATEEVGITLPPVLIPDTEDAPFLRNCEEVQRLFFSNEDSRSSKGVLSTEYFPMEKRVELMEMMIEAAKDPNSKQAQHYLRDHHMMYITKGELPEPKDDDEWNFYLNIDDPKNPVLYRFVKDDTSNKWVPEKMNLDNFVTTTPGKELYKIAKKQGQAGDGDAVRLSCKDVYYNITNQSRERFKTGTAREMYEEIYQAEAGYAKLYESILFTAALVGSGMLALSSGNVLGTLPAIVSIIINVVKIIALTLMFAASFVCAKAAILKNTWFDGGLSSFEKTLDSLKISELKEKVGSIEKMFEPSSGLTAELVTSAGVNDPDEEVGQAGTPTIINPFSPP